MLLTPERKAQATEATVQAAEQAVARRPGESGFSYYLRCLLWVLDTPEGRAAFAANVRKVQE
jgi:hypothetical protein